MIYVDSSAIVKLVVAEPETQALFDYLEGHDELVSSALAKVEVTRALVRAGADDAALARAEQVLSAIALLHLDDPILTSAAALPQPNLRTLDALHLATALSAGELEALVVYDRRLSEAAELSGLTVVAPS